MTHEELEEWLKRQDAKTCVAIAARFAARVWPLTISASALPEPSFSAVRAILVARAADAAYADDAARAAAADDDDAAAATFADCNLVERQGQGALQNTPLWHDAKNPLQAEWSAARAKLGKDPNFGFWLYWYEGLLAGRSQNSDLIRDIALISPEDWDQGPPHIAKKIADIELDYIEKATPLAEWVEWVPDIERIRVTPVPMDNQNLYNTVLNKLRDALEDIRPNGQLGNSRAALGDTLELLDRTLETYADDPQRVHDDMAQALAETQRLIKGNEVAEDLFVGRLMRALEEGTLDIQGAMAEVRAVVQARLALRFQQMSDDDRKTLSKATESIVPLLESDRVQQDMAEDVKALSADDPNTDENKPRLYRWASRMVRFLSIRSVLEKVAERLAVEALIRFLMGG